MGSTGRPSAIIRKRSAFGGQRRTHSLLVWRRGDNNLASLCSITGQIKRAEALSRESLELRVHLLGPDNPEVALSYSNLAVELFREERYNESAALCHQAVTIWSKTDSAHNRSDLAFDTLALIELHNRSFSAGLSFALAALAQYQTYRNVDPTCLASHEHTLALAREAAGQLDLSQQEFRSALALLEGPEQNAPSLVRIGLVTDYARLLKRLKRTKEAKHMLQRAELERNLLVRANQWQHTVDLKTLLPDSTK